VLCRIQHPHAQLLANDLLYPPALRGTKHPIFVPMAMTEATVVASMDE